MDGVSLLPVLRGTQATRPSAIGIAGSFLFGSTNHNVDPVSGVETWPDVCPNASASMALGDIPAGFSTPGQQPQFSWAEGNDLKLFGCIGCKSQDYVRCSATATGDLKLGWRMFLFNLTADPNETTDLWGREEMRPVAKSMLARFELWQTSVLHSQGPHGEIGCSAGDGVDEEEKEVEVETEV